MSDKNKDGGPAFPQTLDSWTGRDGNAPVPGGMSLRDWFAGMALQGLIREMTFEDMIANHERRTPKFIAEVLSEHAHAAADAMLFQREKGEKP